jgi:hypothetical protein
LPEAYQWLLVPVQDTPQKPPMAGVPPLGAGAARRPRQQEARNDELLVTVLAGTRLRMELDRVPLWRGRPRRGLAARRGLRALPLPAAAARVGRDASRIAEEVISHLAGLVGSTVKVTLEVEADMPNGAPEHVVRTVTENSRTLKFSSHGFEDE